MPETAEKATHRRSDTGPARNGGFSGFPSFSPYSHFPAASFLRRFFLS